GRRSVERYTTDRLRSDFVTPLVRLIGEFTTAIDEMERMKKDGQMPKDYVPLNVTMAIRGLGKLQKLRREVSDKLAGSREGGRISREAELENNKKARADKAKSK